MNREDCLKLLRDNEAFKTILSKASNDAERRAIKAYTEDFLMKFYVNIASPMKKAAEEDPEGLKNKIQEVQEQLFKSGSIA